MVSPDEEVLCEIKGYKTAVKTSAVMQVNVQNLDVNLKAIIDANKFLGNCYELPHIVYGSCII